MLNWLDTNETRISSLTKIIQALSITAGILVIGINFVSDRQRKNLDRDRITVEHVAEFYTEIFPEITKSSYAFIRPGDTSFGWPQNYFESYSSDFEDSKFDYDVSAQGHLSIEQLIVLAEPFYQKTLSMLGLQFLDLRQACFGLQNQTLAYLRIIRQKSFTAHMHSTFTGQNNSPSYFFLANCHKNFGTRYIRSKEFRFFSDAEFGMQAANANPRAVTRPSHTTTNSVPELD